MEDLHEVGADYEGCKTYFIFLSHYYRQLSLIVQYSPWSHNCIFTPYTGSLADLILSDIRYLMVQTKGYWL
jgi:hypothetical protein